LIILFTLVFREEPPVCAEGLSLVLAPPHSNSATVLPKKLGARIDPFLKQLRPLCGQISFGESSVNSRLSRHFRLFRHVHNAGRLSGHVHSAEQRRGSGAQSTFECSSHVSSGQKQRWETSVMVNQCANPECRRELRYLRDGRIYLFALTTGNRRQANGALLAMRRLLKNPHPDMLEQVRGADSTSGAGSSKPNRSSIVAIASFMQVKGIT
jgi:hypothetical protein